MCRFLKALVDILSLSSLIWVIWLISMLLGVKRIYDKAEITDGKRILVDGLWPRGIKKSTANIDLWMKAIAPSKELRLWFAHDPKKWQAFKKRYLKELGRNKALADLVEMAQTTDVTLLYSAQDEQRNNAVVLAAIIKKRAKQQAQ